MFGNESEYERRTLFNSREEKDIEFVCVKSVREVIVSTVKDLKGNDPLSPVANFTNDTLSLLISGDKGGKYTKLIFQVLNCKGTHSVKRAKILGIYPGKDKYINTQAIFGPLISELQILNQAHIEELFYFTSLSLSGVHGNADKENLKEVTANQGDAPSREDITSNTSPGNHMQCNHQCMCWSDSYSKEIVSLHCTDCAKTSG